MNKDAIRIAQISDIHLFADPEKTMLGVKTQESFVAVVDLLKRTEPLPDLIILTGDLSQDISKASYIRLAELMKSIPVPIYCIPGNHDEPKTMAEIFSSEKSSHGIISTNKHIILKNWQIILLDSHKPNCVEGYLDHLQLNYLAHCLQNYPEHHAIVVFHHHPFPIGVQWLNPLGLTNTDELWSVLSPYPKAKTILFGHVHNDYEEVINGITCYSAPATCFQFKKNAINFALENTPPGYRWINLHNDGHLETGINRVEKYIGEFESSSKGYKNGI